VGDILRVLSKKLHFVNAKRRNENFLISQNLFWTSWSKRRKSCNWPQISSL